MMVRWISAVLVILMFSVAGIALALLLWWLLKRQKAPQTAPQIEIDAQPVAVDAEPAEVAVEDVPSAPDADVPEIAALDEQPVADVAAMDADADEPASSIDMEVEARPEETVPPAADNLELIDGIGPKISSVLQAAGITTFALLAATEVSGLEDVLETESPRLLRLADPATWPEQARLAAAGDWEGLEAFQGTLKGGRIA